LTVVGQSPCTAEAVVVVVAGVSISGLADQVVTVDVADDELVAGIVFFQNLGIGAVFIDQIVDLDRAVDNLLNAAAARIVGVLDCDGGAEPGGFDTGQAVFVVVEVLDLFFRTLLSIRI
jgi:hypothetical protein